MGFVDHGNYVAVPVVVGPKTVTVAEGTSFSKVIVVSDPESLPFDHMIVEAGAKVDVCILVMPGVSAEIPVKVDITGPGAEVWLSGICISGADETVNIRTDVRHLVHDCVSNQLFAHIAGSESHIGFYGKIVVAPDAQKTEAYQTNRNILLSPQAKADTKPQLEIYADDVKCSHGATVGSLNEEEQFYMRSRGIPEAEAKVLQMISFVSPVLVHVPSEEERERLASEVETAIRRIV